jgi:predicted DNA binding CopG/RHH family protein
MIDLAEKHKWKPRIVKSFRLSSSQLELIKRECASRKIAFSEFIRQSTMLNLKHVRNRAVGN